MEEDLKNRLKKWGLVEFIAKFEEQDLTTVALVETMNETDLEKLGITTVGKIVAFRNAFQTTPHHPPPSGKSTLF